MTVPPDVEIRFLGAGDAAVFARVADGVFDNDIIPGQAARFLDDPAHHIAVALCDGVVVGMASANEYLHPDKPEQLWVNEMGVSPAWQRRGIGTRLLRAVLDLAREKGFDEVWLGTEEENEPARGLYRSLGGAEERFVMYTFDLAGREGARD